MAFIKQKEKDNIVIVIVFFLIDKGHRPKICKKSVFIVLPLPYMEDSSELSV